MAKEEGVQLTTGSNANMTTRPQVSQTVPPPAQTIAATMHPGYLVPQPAPQTTSANMHPRPPVPYATPTGPPSLYDRLRLCFDGCRIGCCIHNCCESSGTGAFSCDMLSGIGTYPACDQCCSVDICGLCFP